MAKRDEMHRTDIVLCGWCSITAGLVICESALTICYLNLMLSVVFDRPQFKWGGGCLIRFVTVQKASRSARADAKPSQCIICTNRAIIIQFTSAVTIISVFGWCYMPYCLCEQCNKFNSNSSITMTHNSLHLHHAMQPTQFFILHKAVKLH